MGGLGELYEDGQEIDKLEEQLGDSIDDCCRLGESVLRLDKSGHRTPNLFWLRRGSVSRVVTR